MDLTLTDVERLMTQFENSDLREFHLNAAPITLTLSKNEWQGVQSPVSVAVPTETVQVAAPSMSGDVETPVENKNIVPIQAELVGTVHLQASPGAEPFVQVGQTIKAGEQVAIIEAMKLMTPVISPVSGTIEAIRVADDDVVAYDDVLFEVTPMEG